MFEGEIGLLLNGLRTESTAGLAVPATALGKRETERVASNKDGRQKWVHWQTDQTCTFLVHSSLLYNSTVQGSYRYLSGQTGVNLNPLQPKGKGDGLRSDV